MAGVQRLVVVAHPRSGSNSLVEILRCHPRMAILNEPLNEGFASWFPANPDYRSRVKDPASLDEVLDEIFETYSGFKLHSYRLHGPLFGHLVARTDLSFILLRRSNLLEAAVSNFIALQTNLWKTWDREAPLPSYYEQLQPLDLGHLADLLAWNHHNLEETEAVLGAVAGDRTFKLGYEDFFLAEREALRARLRAMWSFLGLEPPQDQARLEAFLVPGDVQMGGAATYGQLPNLAEIEATLGNDVTGHITYLAGATPQIVGRNHLRGDQ